MCSTSKIFEKLILNQIHYLESKHKLDLTGKQQHGFKRNKSTATAGALLQSLIARAADEKCYVVKHYGCCWSFLYIYLWKNERPKKQFNRHRKTISKLCACFMLFKFFWLIFAKKNCCLNFTISMSVQTRTRLVM